MENDAAEITVDSINPHFHFQYFKLCQAVWVEVLEG